MRILIGLVLSILISFSALKRNSLNLSGFIGAIILGTSIFVFGGVYFCGIMVCFFVSSSLLTKLKYESKKTLEDINEKTGGRDFVQVMANGGLGLIYAFLYFTTKSPIYILAYAASFSASTADTWSSEVGVLSKKDPISILTFKRTVKGESGAISFLGTSAAFIGSLFISTFFLSGYIFVFGWTNYLLYYFILVLLGGFLGSIIDSLLGATIQAKYKCKVCNKITEKKTHHGENTIHISGWRLVNNDVVNFASGLIVTIIVLSLTKF